MAPEWQQLPAADWLTVLRQSYSVCFASLARHAAFGEDEDLLKTWTTFPSSRPCPWTRWPTLPAPLLPRPPTVGRRCATSSRSFASGIHKETTSPLPDFLADPPLSFGPPVQPFPVEPLLPMMDNSSSEHIVSAPTSLAGNNNNNSQQQQPSYEYKVEIQRYFLEHLLEFSLSESSRIVWSDYRDRRSLRSFDFLMATFCRIYLPYLFPKMAVLANPDALWFLNEEKEPLFQWITARKGPPTFAEKLRPFVDENFVVAGDEPTRHRALRLLNPPPSLSGSYPTQQQLHHHHQQTSSSSSPSDAFAREYIRYLLNSRRLYVDLILSLFHETLLLPFYIESAVPMDPMANSSSSSSASSVIKW
ncbi:hypothetical protein TYRP_013800 [Tyrophagus putrescentiae]|nr:hypothetical protein TYRP_013800 [Tyrophagus putrescentiae]